MWKAKIVINNSTPVRVKDHGKLRDAIKRLERKNLKKRNNIKMPLKTGIVEIDKFLPAGGLNRGALHEFYGPNVTAAGFVTVIAAHTTATENGVVLWCRNGLELYPPGLAFLGLDPERLVFVNKRDSRKLLWAMEEGLRSGAPLVVIGEVEGVSLISLRRLQLAAETGGVTAFLIRSGKIATSSPAVTRWRINAQSSSVGAPAAAWKVELIRVRGGKAGKWEVEQCSEQEKCHETGYLSLVS